MYSSCRTGQWSCSRWWEPGRRAGSGGGWCAALSMGMSLGLVWSAGLVGPPVSERGGQGVAVARRGEGAGAIPLPLERGCAPVWCSPQKDCQESDALHVRLL